MTRKGPVLTLAAGALLAVGLMVMNINATAIDGAGATPYGAGSADPTATPAGAPTTTPTVTPTTTQPVRPATVQATYAGAIGGTGATLAIAVKDGRAIAYLCDGRTTEAWLQGTADNGELVLSGAGGASLSGTFDTAGAQGAVRAAGRSWSFSVATVASPSGLYRATANVRGARVVGGWIVLADGTQVGLLTVGGAAQPAPRLEPASGSVMVEGTAVTVRAIDGTTLD